MTEKEKRRAYVRELDMRIGGSIRQARVAAGLSQTAAAAFLGVEFQQLQKYEAGDNRISAGSLCVLARTLGVKPEKLLPLKDMNESDDLLLGEYIPPELKRIDLELSKAVACLPERAKHAMVTFLKRLGDVEQDG